MHTQMPEPSIPKPPIPEAPPTPKQRPNPKPKPDPAMPPPDKRLVLGLTNSQWLACCVGMRDGSAKDTRHGRTPVTVAAPEYRTDGNTDEPPALPAWWRSLISPENEDGPA